MVNLRFKTKDSGKMSLFYKKFGGQVFYQARQGLTGRSGYRAIAKIIITFLNFAIKWQLVLFGRGPLLLP